MKEQTLTADQALRAMFFFLKNHYDLTNSSDIGSLLGDLDQGIWKDGKPGDPAVWEDWLDSIEKALGESLPTSRP